MLHKSFKPAKCKTALKLAVSRIKLLKNKKEALVKQQKRELAQLLESGQERTARIRVEHVVREEKAMAAYDLIEIYCELIVARMPIIESQKHCPIDLKEAIASVIFASPRCADIPELMDVRKNFTAKYGKEFVAAALEIRPDCGVSRLLVEKLSAKAPDGPAKIKILTAIAEEHNVKWDRESLEENEMKPPEDLLNGPNTFSQASKMHGESSNFQEAPNISNSSQNQPSTFVDASNAMTPRTSLHPQQRTSGNASEAMESRHLYGSGQVSSGRQSWTMEFTDATTAAQAAAESAERASMAARAAAELSSQGRITRQHSTQSNKSSQVQNYGSSRSQGEHIANIYSHDSLRSNNNEKNNEDEEDELSELTERFNNLKSSIRPSRTEYSKSSDFQMADRPSRNTPSSVEKNDVAGEASMKSESSESDEEFARESYSGTRSENVGHFEQASFGKQSSNVSYHSHHSHHPSDEHNVFSNFSRKESSEAVFDEPFISDDMGRNTKETNSYGNAGLVFDDSGSEDDAYKFDSERDSRSYFSSGKSSHYLLANTSTKGPSRGNSFSKTPFSEDSKSIFSEGVASDAFPSQEGNFLPVTFDDSDSPDSDSEDELNKSEDVGRKELETPKSSHSMRSSFAEKKNTRSNSNSGVHASVVDSRVEVEVLSPRNQGIKASDSKSDSKLGYDYLYDNQGSKFYSKSNENENNRNSSSGDDIQGIQSLSTANDDKPVEEPGLESGTGLRFGNLTGGLRNKGYKHPPYRRNALEKQPVSDNKSTRIDRPPPFESFEAHEQLNEKSSSRIPYTDSRSEADEERSLQESYIGKASTETNKKTVSSSYFDSDNSDSDEDLPEQAPATRKTHLSPVLSRRTKASFPDRRKDSSVALPETRSEQSSSSQSNRSLRNSYSTDSRQNRSSQERKSAESSKPREEASRTSESKKLSNLRNEAPSRENSIDKASHVHPKLPDYDTLTAHLLSLRQNRE